MKKYAHTQIIRLLTLFFIVLIVFTNEAACANTKRYRIGVLAPRGYQICLKEWVHTAKYLNNKIKDVSFEIVPLDFKQVGPAVEKEEVDFICINPSLYVELNMRYGVEAIATLKSFGPNKPYIHYGGVIFTKATRDDIKHYKDLKNKKFAVADKFAFGGWISAQRELSDAGINPQQDFTALTIEKTSDKVVYSVIAGLSDAGSIRTGVLEKMAKEGKIDIDDIKVIHEHKDMHTDIYKDFLFLHSTRLYPEWPFARLINTRHDVAAKVAVTLLSIKPDHLAAITGNYAGWTVPLNYQPVHECLQELRIGPYKDFGKITLRGIIQQYWPWIILASILFIALIITTGHVWVLNRKYITELIERRYVQEAFRKSEATVRGILDAIPHAVVGLEERNITFANNAVRTVFGLNPKEIIGQNTRMLYRTDKEYEEIGRHFYPVLQDKATHSEEFICRRKDGQDIICMVSASRMSDHLQKKRIVVMYEDITARKIAERELKEAYQELKDTHNQLIQSGKMAAMGQLAAGVSHELNQPLTGIKGFAQAALMSLGADNSLRSDLEIIIKQADRMDSIIKNVRSFARHSKFALTRVDINKPIEDAIMLLNEQLKTHNIRLSKTLAAKLPQIMADSNQLQQIFINFISNARDAIDCLNNPQGGELFIETQLAQDKKNVIVIFKDTGCGISEEGLENIFNPFFTTKSPDGGMGLGLSIVYRIIEDHKGQIQVESEVGRGTTFKIILPVA